MTFPLDFSFTLKPLQWLQGKTYKTHFHSRKNRNGIDYVAQKAALAAREAELSTPKNLKDLGDEISEAVAREYGLAWNTDNIARVNNMVTREDGTIRHEYREIRIVPNVEMNKAVDKVALDHFGIENNGASLQKVEFVNPTTEVCEASPIS